MAPHNGARGRWLRSALHLRDRELASFRQSVPTSPTIGFVRSRVAGPWLRSAQTPYEPLPFLPSPLSEGGSRGSGSDPARSHENPLQLPLGKGESPVRRSMAMRPKEIDRVPGVERSEPPAGQVATPDASGPPEIGFVSSTGTDVADDWLRLAQPPRDPSACRDWLRSVTVGRIGEHLGSVGSGGGRRVELASFRRGPTRGLASVGASGFVGTSLASVGAIGPRRRVSRPDDRHRDDRPKAHPISS
jgi:hypothetical protein